MKAPDSDSALRFAKLAGETITVERSLHENYGKRWRMTAQQMSNVPMAPTNYAYTRDMLNVAHAGSAAEITVGALPCAWIFCVVGQHLLKKGPPPKSHPYRDWLMLLLAFQAHSRAPSVLVAACTLQPTLRRTPYKVRSEIAAGVAMDSYPGPLGQVLTNLLTNALVHGFEGRGKGLIEITGEPGDDGQVCLTVADDGTGIPAELLDRVFDPFVTTKLGRGGTGLGLHIVWNTVTVVLGGSISVDSTPGQGTRFRIILPVVAPSQPAAD